jgi:hypothetical protein
MDIYLKNGLLCAVIGAGIGGIIGIAKSIKETKIDPNKPPQETTSVSSFETQYPNLALDPASLEAVNRLKTYQAHIANEIRIVVQNLDQLIYLQILVNSGRIEPHLSYRAITYSTNISTALAVAKTKLRNVSAPHLETDIEMIENISQTYVYNIGKEVDQHLLSRHG